MKFSSFTSTTNGRID